MNYFYSLIFLTLSFLCTSQNIYIFNFDPFPLSYPSFSFKIHTSYGYLDLFPPFKPNNFNKYIIRAMPTRKNSEEEQFLPSNLLEGTLHDNQF